MIIRGNTLATSMPRADYAESDEKSAAYIQNKPDAAIEEAATAAAAADRAAQNAALRAEEAHALAQSALEQSGTVSLSVSLPAESWQENSQSVPAPVTAESTVLVTPAPESFVAWGEAVVYCAAQGEGTLTFRCEEPPSDALTANILILKGGSA